jgi:protein SHQ1
MPITPRFTISQNDEYVLIEINVPHIRVSTAELIADNYDFTFFCNPYLLKLTFPYEFEGEDERCKATYDVNKNNGTMTAHLPKRVQGQNFPDLDLTTRLLHMRKDKDDQSDSKLPPLPPVIEIIGSKTNDNNTNEEEVENLCEDIESLNITDSIFKSKKPHYGFNMKYSSILGNLREDCLDMIEIIDPDKISPFERRALRLERENSKFDAERYLGDYFGAEEDSIFIEAMDHETMWTKLLESQDIQIEEVVVDGIDSDNPPVRSSSNSSSNSSSISNNIVLTSDEQEILSNSLCNREYLIPSGSLEENRLLISLTDILFAYCYDSRITLEEPNVESAYTISRLSSTLSWLDSYIGESDEIMTSIKSFCRRSLIYPYIRSWDLTCKILGDVSVIFSLGKRCILKVLLKLRSIFEHTDTHYLLNKLYLDDYCVWIQSLNNDVINEFSKLYDDKMKQFMFNSDENNGKSLIGFNLPELEEWAYESMESGVENDKIPNMEIITPQDLLGLDKIKNKNVSNDLLFLCK